MGAGRGRTRRSLAVLLKPLSETQSGAAAGFEWKKWLEFVDTSALNSTKLYKYYLGPDLKESSAARSAEVATGLFADAVQIGAIRLASGFNAEDFCFAAEDEQSLRVFPKGKTQLSRQVGGAEGVYSYNFRANSFICPYFTNKTTFEEAAAKGSRRGLAGADSVTLFLLEANIAVGKLAAALGAKS
jgi:hypothetical protein